MEELKHAEKELITRENISEKKTYRKPAMVIYNNLSEVTGGGPSNPV